MSAGHASGGVDPLGLTGSFPRPGWVVLDAARDRRFTGELVFDTTPAVRVYLERGHIYLAERVTDPSLGARLVDAGALTAVQLERGALRIGDAEHLGRLFERVPSIDRHTVLVTTELMNDECTSWLAVQLVHRVSATPYRQHPSGIQRWDRPPRWLDLAPGDPLPAPAPDETPVGFTRPESVFARDETRDAPIDDRSDDSIESELDGAFDDVIRWNEPSWLDRPITTRSDDRTGRHDERHAHSDHDRSRLRAAEVAADATGDPFEALTSLGSLPVAPLERFELLWPSGEVGDRVDLAGGRDGGPPAPGVADAGRAAADGRSISGPVVPDGASIPRSDVAHADELGVPLDRSAEGEVSPAFPAPERELPLGELGATDTDTRAAGANQAGADGAGGDGAPSCRSGLDDVGANELGANRNGVNGVASNGVAPNGVAPNGARSNGVASNGAGANGAGSCRSGLDDVGANELGANRDGVNGAGSNGVASSGPGSDDGGSNGAATNGAGPGGGGANEAGANEAGSNGAAANLSGETGVGTNRANARGAEDQEIPAGLTTGAVAAHTESTDDVVMAVRRAVASIETGSLGARRRLVPRPGGSGPVGDLTPPSRVAARAEADIWASSPSAVIAGHTGPSVFDEQPIGRLPRSATDAPSVGTSPDGSPPGVASPAGTDPTGGEARARTSALRRLIGSLRRR